MKEKWTFEAPRVTRAGAREGQIGGRVHKTSIALPSSLI